MDDPPQLPPKQEVANALLEGPSLFAHLDPRKADVVVPNWLRKQSQLVLQVGMNMAVPIPDLKVGDEGISCTLSFNRSPFWCLLPWTAIYALVGEDGRGMVWPDDVPAELAEQSARPKLSVVESKKKPRAKPAPKATLAAVEDEPSDAEDEPDSEPPPAEDGDEKKKLPPYLRVVK